MTAQSEPVAPATCTDTKRRSSTGLCTRFAKLAGTAAILAACNGAPVEPPSADTTVLAWRSRSAEWQPALVEDLSYGEELLHDGQLYRVGDTDLVWLGAPTQDALAQADAAYTEVDCHAAPLQDDWVLVFAVDDERAHHARLWEVDDGTQIAIDGRLFLVVNDQPEATGDVLGRVVNTYERQAPQVIDAVIEYADAQQDTLTGTPNHPFWVPARGAFVPLGELEIGTALHVQDGGEALLVSKTWRQGDFTVFDVEVAGLHAFYVGDDGGAGAGVLVHNSGASKAVPKPGAAGGPGAGKAFPKSVKDKARVESGDTCVFCGTETTGPGSPSGPKKSEIDHSIPKSRGGNNTIDNAQNSCRTCNRKKGAKTTEEFVDD